MINMLGLVLKNLFFQLATRLYPYVKTEPYERFRGKLEFNLENCIYCGICQRKCPADAISVIRESKTWELNPLRCIICGECVSPCPKKCLTLSNIRRECSTIKEKLGVNTSK